MEGKRNITNILIYLGFALIISAPFIVGSFFIPNKVIQWVVFGVGLFLALFLAGIIEDKIISKQKKVNNHIESKDETK